MSLRGVERFSREQLYQHFMDTEGALTMSTLGWRIYELTQKLIMQEVETGWYTLDVKPVYTPIPDKRIIKIDKIIRERYRKVKYCVWNINWLNEFTLHQFNRDIIVVETEKDLRESIAYTLLDNGFNNIVLQMMKDQFFITHTKDPILILPVISRAPTQYIAHGRGQFGTAPSLEKILVDIYTDERTFYFVQGAELEKIFDHALRRYAINWTTLLGYAKRRGKGPALRAFLKDRFSDIFKPLIE